MISKDTICAVATPPGIGGIAIVRLSGPDAFIIADRCFRGKAALATVPTHTIHYGKFYDGPQLIDTVTASVFRAPHSYTGEDVVEFGCHGGPLVTQQILNALITAGARHAEPGEFTKRAFLNGKLDLTQVEAVADLIHAQTIPGAQAAARQLVGGLTRRLQQLRQQLIDIAGLLELELDFAEEDIELIDRETVIQQLNAVHHICSELAESVVAAEILRGGYVVGIVGYPNAGKSSLLNALLGKQRAIVSDLPGTTRDYIEEVLFLDGMSIKLVDTAGLRDKPADRIELEGIELAHSILQQSNLVLVLNDASLGFDHSNSLLAALQQRYPQSRYLLVHNKLDLIPDPPSAFPSNGSVQTLGISARTGEGLGQLKRTLATIAKEDSQRVTDGLINERQATLLAAAARSLAAAIDALRAGLSNEFVAVEVREALNAIGKITGEVYTDEVLQAIFSRFCIGK